MPTDLIVYYSIDENHPTFPFKFEEDTFWTTQKVMAGLFGVESNTIAYHLQEIFKSEELQEASTTRKFRVVQNENGRNVSRTLQFYNLDAIIAVGYRVNSKSATAFRKWATSTLHDVIMTNLSESKTFKNMSEIVGLLFTRLYKTGIW